MSALEKAILVKLKDNNPATEDGTEIPVQFNPSSLKLTLSNNTEGGTSTARPARQYTGNSSTELAFDLVFDSADEVGSNGTGPYNVRDRTRQIEQFVLAQTGGSGGRQSPPRVMFKWGGLKIKGVISQLSIDFDLFASDGSPLRAKMAVSIKEQDAKYEMLEAGPGSAKSDDAKHPGEGDSATPGGGGGTGGAKAGVALDGETAADFAARMGLDPGAWRGLSLGGGNPLSLSAGLEIGFDASLSLSAGVGLSVGFSADVGVSLEASLGLEASASISAGASFSSNASASAGFALSAAGGVGAAIETAAIAKAAAATKATVQSFGASGASTATSLPTGGSSAAASGVAAAFLPSPTGSAASGGGRAATGGAASGPAPAGGASAGTAGTAASNGAATVTTPTAAAAAATASASATGTSAAPAASAGSTPNAYAPPRADPRATSFGFGVPLRPRTTPSAATAGIVALRPYARSREVPVTSDPTAPPWVSLPQTSKQSTTSTGTKGRSAAQPKRTNAGCGCGCGPRRGGR
jgi:hypothetical protein